MARKLIGQHTRTLLHTHTDKDTARKTSTSLHINVIVTREERKDRLKESRHQLNVFYTFYKNLYATLFDRQAFWFAELTLAAQFVG